MMSLDTIFFPLTSQILDFTLIKKSKKKKPSPVSYCLIILVIMMLSCVNDRRHH
jgi:hypothetical protein